MRDVTHSCVWHDSLDVCYVTCVCVWHEWEKAMQHTATHCNTLQHTATHCYTLLHTATHCYTLQHTATHCNTLQHTAKHCNTLQHTATHSNILQHDWETAVHTLQIWRVQMFELDSRIYMLLCVAVCCCALQYFAVCCSVLQCVARLTNIYDMTLTYVSHDSFICVAWLIRVCIRVCDVTDSYVCHDSSIHAKQIRTYTHTYIHTYTHKSSLMVGGWEKLENVIYVHTNM